MTASLNAAASPPDGAAAQGASVPHGPGEAFSRVFCDMVTDSGDIAVPLRPTPRGDSVADTTVAVVIEDDEDIRELVSTVLEQAGYLVHAAGTGAEGVELVRTHHPVVTTLDLSMPGMDGFETAKRIRAISSTYIVMLTARTDEIDTIQGLQSGADDYLTKPFRPRELRARIEAMLRRPRTLAEHRAASTPGSAHSGATPAEANENTVAVFPAQDDTWVEHRGIRLHPQMRVVTREGQELELTRSEFDILSELLQSGRRVVGKADLVLMLRGEQDTGSTTYVTEHDTRTIEVHVANLRRKLGESATHPRWIETIRGVGYRITAT